MNDSANKLSKQRRRRRILMHDDDEDDSTPRKIQSLIQSERSFTTFNETDKKTTSPHTERTISSFSSVEQSKTTTTSRRNDTGSSEVHTSSNESFSKSESSKVESYSAFTKTEGTYRSYSRTDKSSSSVHKSSTVELPVGVAELSSIANIKGVVGTDSSRPKHQIGRTDHTSGSLESFRDFEKISRDDRDISIIDTEKSHAYHDVSIKEGHSQKSDKNSSEHRRFKTDSEKYSYSDKENTKIDYTRSEQHEVTERRGLVAPEEDMSVLGRNNRPDYNTREEGLSPYFHDPNSLIGSTHSIEDLLGRRKNQNDKSKTAFKITPDVRTDEPEELSEMHVASIRDRVRLMRASMGNQSEETEDNESDQDHETEVDTRFSSYKSTDDLMKGNQTSTLQENQLMTSETETVSTDRSSELIDNDSRNMPRDTDQTVIGHIRAETETKTEQEIESVYVNATYEFGKPDKQTNQDRTEDTKNYTETTPSEFETNDDLKITENVNHGQSEEGKTENASADFEIEILQNPNVLECEMMPSTTITSEEKVDIEQEVSAKSMESSGNLAEQAADHETHFIKSDITRAMAIKSLHEIPPIEVETGYKTSKIPADNDHDLAEKQVDLTDGKHSMITGTYGETPLFENEVKFEEFKSALHRHTEGELNKEDEPSRVKTDTAESLNLNAASSGSVQLTATGNVSEEIITIQTGIVTSVEPSAELDGSKQLSIPKKTFGSDEVIIIHGVPTRKSYDTQLYKTLEHNTEADKATVNSSEEITQHEMRSTEITKSLKFGRSKLNLRSYAPRPYQKVHKNPRGNQQPRKPSSEIQSREIQSTYFQFQEPSTVVKTDEKSEVNKPPYGALHRPEKQNTHDDEEKENKLMLRESLNGNSNVDQPARTPSYGEHGDLLDSPMETEDTVEPISYGNATEAQSNDSLQTYTQPFDTAPENKSDDGETFKTSRDEDHSHDSPQNQEDKDEKMSCKPTKVQPNDNLQPCLLLPDVGLETKPESAWQPDTPPHDEETDEFTSYDLPGAQEKASPTSEDASELQDKKANLWQPYETPPQDEDANEFMSYDTRLKYVPTEDSIQSRGQLPDLQPEKISIDVWQSYENFPNKNALDNLMFHDIHPSETQAKDEQDDPSPYQNHKEQATAAQTGTKCENTHDETDAGPSMLYKYYPTEEPSKENQQSGYPLLASKSEKDDQPYGTQEHAEPDKLESCDPFQAEVEPIHEPKKVPEHLWDNTEHYKYDDDREEMNESIPYQTTSYETRPYETHLQELQSFRTPANDLQTQGEKEDVQYLSEKHNARKGSKPLDSYKPDKIQEQEKPPHDAKSEKMALDTTDDYDMETVGIQSDEALSYDVIRADNKETDNGAYQTTRNIPLHTPAPLEFQPIESSPFESQTFDIDGVNIKQIDTYGINQPHKTVHEELQDVPSETVFYSKEVVMKHWPVTEQLGDLEQEPQPMDAEFENQSSVTTRREVVTPEETTVRGLYSENSSTEDTPRYPDKDPMLNESFSHVQIEHVTFEDNKLEPVYAEPYEDISFEPILVLDDVSDKRDSNDQRNIEKMLDDSKNVDVHHYKFEMNEIMDTEDSQKQMEQSFGYIDQDMKPYSVERHEERTHETIPYESRANDLQPRQPPYMTEQLSDKEDEETADLEDTEAYEISRRQIRSFKTTSYESQPYEMGQPGSQSLRAWPYKIEPKDKHDDTISDDHLYHTDVYNIQKRELRSYKTTSWESQQYETEPSTLQYSQSRSYETEPRDNESDATLGDRLKDNEALEVNKSDDTVSYESFIYDEQPGKLNGQDVIHDPGKRASMLNTDGYSLQNNAPIHSNLDLPPRKEKIPDTYEESQDHDIDPSSAPSVTILRKIRVTKSNRFPTAETPDVKKTGSENTNVPLISEDKSNTNVVVEKVSASKKDVLESMQEEVDKVFTLMEYQAADHEGHFSHSDPPQSKDGLNQYRDTEQQLTISDQTPLRKYRVESNIQLSPFERPESKRLTKSWKSEPILNVDPIDDDRLSKTRRWKSTNFEKKILKQSSVTIELQKPQRRPLLPPAYSVDKLPFETIIRNEVNIKLKKKKRRNSLPSNTMLDTDSDVPDGATSPREILPREIQTEEIERKQVQLSESYETIDALFEDNFEDEAGEIPDYNKENEPDYDETVESSVQSPLKRKNFEPTPLDKKKPRKSRLNIVPLTVRPKSFKDEPTFVVVRQQHSTDTTYGRVESALSYKVHHAVTSETPRDDIVIEEAVLDEKPRDDIVIEETDLDEQLPKQQPHDEETYRVDTKETIADFDEKNDLYTSTRKFKTRNVNDNVIKVPKEPEDIQGSEDGENEPVRELSPQPKLKRSTKRRQRILIDKQDLKEAIGNNEPPILPSMDTTRLQNELFDTNEEPKPIKPAVDVARYLDDDDDNYVSKPPYFGYIPNSTVSPPEDLYRSNETEASPQPSEDFYQHLGKPNAGKAPDTTNGISTDQHLISPINIDQYLGQMVENKEEGKRLDDTMDDLETYEANKEIQRLLEKVSDDEEEPVKPLLPRQTIEVILIDETKKKKKKKPKKTKIETAPDETVFHEPMPNDFELLQPTAAEIVKPVQGKKERVDTKEIAVQTMPVPDDMDSEDDSDQEILQYQQRSTIGGYLINTIPEEQEDESPLSTPDQNSGSSIYEQHIYRERGFLFRNTHDHEPTPRRPNQINEKEAYSDPSFLPQKYFSEPTIKHDEERLSEFSPYESNHSPQIHETPQNQSYQPEPWQEEKQPDQPDDEEKGFDFDKSRQDIQSSSTINTEGLLKPIYKPRFEIQDFIEEDHRRQTRLVIQAPPSKKHKMSSPYSPIDDTLLGRDPHQKDEPVPVLDEPQSVTPSYAPKYEIHDFAMQDVEEKLKPMPSTITNGFVLEENEHEIETYPDSEQDLCSDILNQADTEKRSENVASKQDGLTFTESEYLPRLDPENSKDQCLEPLNNDELPTKHDTPEHILPRYEPRFEIQDLIAKESQRDEQPKYGDLTKRTESPVFISPKDPELLSNQPGFEVTSFILNEEPGREEKYNDQESDTDDSLSNLYNQPAYKPRYIMDEVPSNKTYKVDVTLEENKGMPFQPIGKEIIRQTTEAERKEEKRPSYRSQQQPVPDYRATVPLTEQEPVISPYEIGEVVLEPQSQRIGSKPIQTKTSITTSATFVEEEPKPLEEKREPEHTSSAYQPRCEIINFVLQEQPEQPEEFEVKVKKEETKPNRSFRRPKLTVDEIILQEGLENEDESISSESVQKQPVTDETVQINLETKFEDEQDFYRPYQPQHKVKVFVLDEDPLLTRALPEKQDESTADNSTVASNELNFTKSAKIPKYEIQDLEREHKVREFVMQEPENEIIPKHPTTDQTVQTSTETTVEDEPGFYKLYEPQHEIKSFVLDEGILITRGLPKKQDESTTDKSPVSINERNFTRSVNIPKYEIPDLEKEHKAREIVIEEEPENERIPKHPTTDETVQTSTETTVEDEPDFYRPFEPQHEVKSFLLEEGPLITRGLPKKQDESTTDKSPVYINELNFTRSVNIPKYEIPDLEKEHKAREIVIEEEPENERIPKHPTTDETVQTSTETTVEDEPDFYRPFEPQHEVKSFLLEEGPLITRGLPKKQDESTTDKSPVYINELNFTRSVNIPKYEIPDLEKEHKAREIVIEEEPENERIPKHPTTDETVQTSTETTVEDEPDFYRSFEPQHEVKSFVLEEGPLITRGLPKKQDESTTNRSPVAINELNFTGSVSIPKYEIQEVSFVSDEGSLITNGLPKKHDESTADQKPISLSEPDYITSVNIPKYEIPDVERVHKAREFVIEEEPENERISQQPTINETVQITTETSVEDEPDVYRPFEPQHQVKNFALDEDPLITRDLLEKQDESTADKTPVVTNELNFTRSVNIAKYEIPGVEREHKVREFIIEEEPEDESIPKYTSTDETVQTSTETTVEDEPDFYRPFEPQQEVSFVSDEGPLITNGLPKKHDESTTDQTPISMNEPDYVRSVNIPKCEMPGTEREDKAREFVIDEKPENERQQKRPVTNEKTQTSIQAMNEEEPDVYRPFQEKDKVKGFVSDEDPLIQQVEPKGQVKTTTGERFVPDYIRSAGNLEQKFTDSELDSRNYQPHMGDETTDQVDAHTTSVSENKPKRPEGQDNIVLTTERQDYSTNVTPYVKEKQEQEIKTISAVKQERIRFRYQQRYKLEDFVLIEEPEQDEGPPSTSNEKSYESFRIIAGDQGPHTTTPQNLSGNAPLEKGLNQEEVPKETNIHPKFVIGKEEPREITVNTVETSQINYESHQEVETILEDEPSRLDIDYVNDDPSENAGPEFKSDLQTMLSHRYGTKEKAILIAEGESIDKTTSRPLKQENKIEAGLLEDIETQANAFSAENVSKTRNVDDSGNKTDTKFNSPFAADDIRSVENPEEIVENVTGEINPAKTLVLEDEMEHFEPEPQKTMGSVDEKTGISTDKKSAGIETITTERTNELETEDSSQSETDDIIANLAGGKERMDRDENIDIQIVPSYIREVYPTEVTPTERPLLEQEIQEESSENVTIKTMKNIPQIEKREERSIDIATVNEYLRRQTAEETVISNQQEKTQGQTTQLHEEHSELLKTTEETYVYPKDESQPSIAKSLTLISVDAVDGEQEEIPIASESLPLESDGLSQLVKQSSPRQADIKSPTVTEEMEQDTLPKGGEDIAVEMSNMSEIIEHGVEAERVDDINIIAEQTSTEKESAIIYPLNRPEGMIIQLVDDIVEPSQPAFRGTTIIEKPEQRGYLKKGTEHTTIHEISRPAHHELENSRTEFTENIPNSAEQRFVRDVDLQSEIETGPLYTNKGEMIAQDGKKLASADVEYLEMNDVQEVENVNSEEDEIINIGREAPGSTYGWELNFAELSTKGPVMLEIENERQSMMTTIDSVQNNEDIDIITERYQRETVHGLISESQPTRGIAVDHKADLPTTKTERAIMNDEIPSRSIKESKFETRTNMGLVTVYPLNEPQGITIQLIDDIEPVEPEHEGTAVIQKIIDEKPARTIHTPKYYHSEITDTKTTEFLEDIPPANIGQTFARDFKDDIPTTFVDGKSGGIGGDASDKSEHAVIKGSLVSGDPVSNTHTREQFNETDAINHEESEVISIASGTSSLDLQDDITIEPSYVRQVDPSGLVITETIGGKEEIVQLNELPSTTGESDTAQRKLERSMEIKTVTELYEPGQSIRMLKPTNSEFDQEHIYARVNKELLGIRDENTKPMALVGKSSVDSVIVDHQPGATTIAMVEKRSVPVFEKGQIDDKDFGREVYNRNSEQGEISQSTDTMPRVSYTGTKDQGSLNEGSLNEGVVWMTVRHSKKLFSVGGNERIITLPIVNNLPSSNFSPTEDLDFDLDNDGEMFSQRHKQDASGEYYTSTRVLGLEEISVHRESIMMKESEQDERQQSGTRTSVLDDKSEVAEGTSRIAMEQFKEPGDGEIQEQDVEKKEVRELQQERYHDYPRADEYENECIESASLKTSEDVSRQSMRETITVDNWTAEDDVWCTVKLKRWESDIRGIHSSNKFKGKGASELSSSTASIDGTYEEDTDRPQSPNSEISMKTESSVPWKSVTRKSKKGANAKDHQAGESIGYSMQLTATDAGVLMTEEDTLSGVETLDTESTVSTNMGDVTTLPWIEVQKRGSIRQRFSITKKKRDGTLKGVTHTTDGKDRLLLVKIPQTMLLEIENDDKMLETEVEIPWMELDQSAGEMQGCLPWVELAEQSKNTETDRILMLKISRQMILKASKDSKTGESEIQLPWNDVVKYWEETGQITPGSLARSDKPGSANIAITFPSESASDNQLLEEHPNLPNMRLILPKKRCLDGSLRLKPMITVNEKRNIKVRINKSVKRKHDWSTILRLSKSERRKKYANVTGEDDWVVLADGTKWWRLQIGDMEKVSQLSQISDGQKFENYFEISSEDTDGRESVDFNEFAKELGAKKQKQFSFVIDPKNLLSSAKSF